MKASIKTARRLLTKHPDRQHEFNIIAIAYNGNNVVSYGFNRPKGSPEAANICRRYGIQKAYDGQAHDYVSHSLHAEQDALKRATNGSEIDEMLVVRLSAKGNLVNARPCNVCMKYLEESTVKVVHYSKDGNIHSEKVISNND